MRGRIGTRKVVGTHNPINNALSLRDEDTTNDTEVGVHQNELYEENFCFDDLTENQKAEIVRLRLGDQRSLNDFCAAYKMSPEIVNQLCIQAAKEIEKILRS